MTPHATDIGSCLVRAGMLSASQADNVRAHAARHAVPLLEYLIRQRQLPARDLAVEIASQHQLPLLDLDSFDLDHCPVPVIGMAACREHRVIPLAETKGRLLLALSDPTAPLGGLRLNSGQAPRVTPIIVEDDKLTRALEKISHDAGSRAATATPQEASAPPEGKGTGPTDSEAPVVALLDELLGDAVFKRASDIHLEPFRDELRVRLRVDGVLHTARSLAAALAPAMTARVKILANLNIAEKRLPQDGQFTFQLERRGIDIRVNTTPVLWGEKTVMRLLDSTTERLSVSSLGFIDHQERDFLAALNKRQGLIIITGPTGSGKTQTVFAGLGVLNEDCRNIATVEDPAEIQLPGINQVQVNQRVGLDFATALRALLRQDPDVVLVGEMRDMETAEIALKAAQTGHLVLSTLHANGAAETLSRLSGMGIPGHLLGSAIHLIVAQRLLRRLCVHCRTPLPNGRELLAQAGLDQTTAAGQARHRAAPATVFKAQGCGDCLGGYKGRVGVYEVVPISPAMRRIIIAEGNAEDLREQLRQDGVVTLGLGALRHAAAGLTTLEEAGLLT